MCVYPNAAADCTPTLVVLMSSSSSSAAGGRAVEKAYADAVSDGTLNVMQLGVRCRCSPKLFVHRAGARRLASGMRTSGALATRSGRDL